MADINFSLDEYIQRKHISVPGARGRGGGRGARGGFRGGLGRGGGGNNQSFNGGSRGGRSVSKEGSVKPLMRISTPIQRDARDRIIENVRKTDARDKIILKNRSKYRDAREKIGYKQEDPPEPHQPPPQQVFDYRHRHPTVLPVAEVNGRPLEAKEVENGDDTGPPRRRPDAQVIGRDNNIIVMAKNDLRNEPSPPMRGNPVIMIKNERAVPREPEQQPQPPHRRREAISPPPKASKAPQRRETAGNSAKKTTAAPTPPRRQPPNRVRSRSPVSSSRLAPRQPAPHYNSASEDESPPPKPKQAPPKRAAPTQERHAPRNEKPTSKRSSPEPSRPSGRPSSSTQPSPAKKSTSILHGIKPLTNSQIPKKETTSDGPEKESPIQGYRVLVSNLHSIVTQEDVVELFSACGALKRTKMIKPSVAEVVFVKKEDAEMAVKKYNNRELDGQPMQCKMVSNPAPKSSSQDGPSLGGRLKPAAPSGDGVEATTIHKALFNASTSSGSKTKPVVFTVKI